MAGPRLVFLEVLLRGAVFYLLTFVGALLPFAVNRLLGGRVATVQIGAGVVLWQREIGRGGILQIRGLPIIYGGARLLSRADQTYRDQRILYAAHLSVLVIVAGLMAPLLPEPSILAVIGTTVVAIVVELASRQKALRRSKLAWLLGAAEDRENPPTHLAQHAIYVDSQNPAGSDIETTSRLRIRHRRWRAYKISGELGGEGRCLLRPLFVRFRESAPLHGLGRRLGGHRAPAGVLQQLGVELSGRVARVYDFGRRAPTLGRALLELAERVAVAVVEVLQVGFLQRGGDGLTGHRHAYADTDLGDDLGVGQLRRGQAHRVSLLSSAGVDSADVRAGRVGSGGDSPGDCGELGHCEEGRGYRRQD